MTLPSALSLSLSLSLSTFRRNTVAVRDLYIYEKSDDVYFEILFRSNCYFWCPFLCKFYLLLLITSFILRARLYSVFMSRLVTIFCVNGKAFSLKTLLFILRQTLTLIDYTTPLIALCATNLTHCRCI